MNFEQYFVEWAKANGYGEFCEQEIIRRAVTDRMSMSLYAVASCYVSHQAIQDSAKSDYGVCHQKLETVAAESE